MRHRNHKEPGGEIDVRDFLWCKACAGIIWTPEYNEDYEHLNKKYFRYSDIDRAYYNHLRDCFKLKRMVVELRKEVTKVE